MRERVAQLLPELRAALVLWLIAVLFAGLDAAFVFSGPFQAWVPATLPVFLLAGALMMAAMAARSRFRCVYTGFQDEPVVILAGVASAAAAGAGGVVDDRLYAGVLSVVLVSTVVTGLFFLLLGKLGLGRLIRYVPFSVTAGFMIAVGLLLASGGIALAESRAPMEVLAAIGEGEVPFKTLFAVAVAGVIVLAVRRAGGIAGMPIACGGVLALFYLGCAITGLHLPELAAAGWIMPGAETAPRETGWSILFASGIDWRFVLSEWRNLLSIAVISALALLLAVTALELSTRQRVDVDRELRAAGFANLASAAAGGAAGYHDDAVSAMLHKSLGAGRAAVYAAAVACAAMAFVDPRWFARLPLPLLGGMLVWLGWQLWRDWLVYSGKYLHRGDWIAVIAIVAVTLSSGFIAGVLLGIGVGIALFLIDYSQVSTVRYVVNGREIRSNVDRSGSAEQTLYEQGRRVRVIKLQGYLFFARSHQVLVQLEPVLDAGRSEGAPYILIDFHGVAGIDSTATMAFVRLRQMASEVGATLVFTGLGIEARVDLAREELAEGIQYFRTLDQGLAWCEEQLLAEQPDPDHRRLDGTAVFDAIVALTARDGAPSFLRDIRVEAGQTLIEAGSEAAEIYLVVEGSLSVRIRGVGDEQIVLRGLEAGSVFGEMAIYLGGRRSAAVVAETAALVRALDAASLERLEREDPSLAAGVHKLLGRLLATKLRQTNTWLSHLR
ncbi:MAG: cyclic nucleotide-binding domain-containing protein [Gammaproteobacteria bacterium]